MRWLSLLASAVALAVVVVLTEGCGGSSHGAWWANGQNWEVEQVVVGGKEYRPPRDMSTSLRLRGDGTFQMFDGLNPASGHYERTARGYRIVRMTGMGTAGRGPLPPATAAVESAMHAIVGIGGAGRTQVLARRDGELLWLEVPGVQLVLAEQ